MLELITEFLTTNDLVAERVDETTWLVPTDGDGASWNTQITAIPDFDQVLVFADMDIEMDSDRAGELAVWAALANRGLPLGNFEVDLDECAVWFKTSIDVEGDDLSVALIENLMASNFATVNQHIRGLLGLSVGALTIEEAIDLALGEETLDEDELSAGIAEVMALVAEQSDD